MNVCSDIIAPNIEPGNCVLFETGYEDGYAPRQTLDLTYSMLDLHFLFAFPVDGLRSSPR